MADKKTDKAEASAPVDTEIETADGTVVVPGLTASTKSEHGGQVHLTGRARAAARGGLHGDIMSNTMARDAEVGANRAGDGMTPDGSTPDGSLPPDVVDGADQAVYGPSGQGEGKPEAKPDAKAAKVDPDAKA